VNIRPHSKYTQTGWHRTWVGGGMWFKS